MQKNTLLFFTTELRPLHHSVNTFYQIFSFCTACRSCTCTFKVYQQSLLNVFVYFENELKYFFFVFSFLVGEWSPCSATCGEGIRFVPIIIIVLFSVLFIVFILFLTLASAPLSSALS
jgi:hypothetical protein